MTNPNRMRAEELARAHYVVRVDRDQTPGGDVVYIAHPVDMDTCIGQGDTFEDAVADVRLALVDFIEVLLDHGQAVPQPSPFGAAET